MLGRRGFMKLMGAAPIAAKQISDKAIADLGGMATTPGAVVNIDPTPGVPSVLSRGKMKAALMDKVLGSEIESIFYKNERTVVRIDPDIAVHRSFSVNAKVTFQRQRNVRRRIDDMTSEYWHDEMMAKIKEWIGGC